MQESMSQALTPQKSPDLPNAGVTGHIMETCVTLCAVKDKPHEPGLFLVLLRIS